MRLPYLLATLCPPGKTTTARGAARPVACLLSTADGSRRLTRVAALLLEERAP